MRLLEGALRAASLCSRHRPATAGQRFEATGSKAVTDGEQAKGSFAIYPIHGLTNIAADGIPIPFAYGRHSVVSPHHIGGRSSDDSKLKVGR
jgi:hypothetical protein